MFYKLLDLWYQVTSRIRNRYKVEKVVMTKENRMWRIGGGYNKGFSFFRVDFGSVGFRFTRK